MTNLRINIWNIGNPSNIGPSPLVKYATIATIATVVNLEKEKTTIQITQRIKLELAKIKGELLGNDGVERTFDDIIQELIFYWVRGPRKKVTLNKRGFYAPPRKKKGSLRENPPFIKAKTFANSLVFKW